MVLNYNNKNIGIINNNKKKKNSALICSFDEDML